MLQNYKKWLLNAPILKKLLPMQRVNMLVIACIGLFSMLSVYNVNTLSQNMYANSIQNQQIISSTLHNLYTSRIVLRDIIIEHQNKDDVVKYYASLHDIFNLIDAEMKFYLDRIPFERQERFRITIAEKDKYKELIFKLADTIVIYNNHAMAIQMLGDAKQISADFYDHLNTFIAEERAFMDAAMKNNEVSSKRMYIGISILCLLSVVFIYYSVHYSVGQISSHVVGLTKSVSSLIDSTNMKKDISSKYFTDDEIGFMAKIINKLKNMLIDHSNTDFLTGGYNATAYRNDLDEFFINKDEIQKFWILIFDMNNLKMINDTQGHIAGDNAIRQAYEVLEGVFAQYGSIYRVGGDEFVAILQKCDEAKINKLISSMNEKIDYLTKEEKSLFSIASASGEFVGSTRDEYDAFYLKVDMKMYKNKKEMKSHRSQIRGYK